MPAEVDVVVVGAGLMGAATAWSLARRGVSVTVLERFEPHHLNGSSHGSARIVRRAYEDALYTQLTGQAFELWRELELANDVTLLRMLGGLDFGPHRNVDAVAAHLAAARVPHDLVDPREAERRWVGMRFSGPVVFHEQAGTVDAERAVDVLLADAQRHGAEVAFGARVHDIAVGGDNLVEVGTDERVLLARSVALTPGAWLSVLAGPDVVLPPLEVTQQQVFHFPRLDPSAPPWPSVIHEEADLPIYHLAGGRDGTVDDDRKIGRHNGGRVTTGDTRDGVVDPAAQNVIVDYVKRWLPGLDPTPRNAATCLYTTTPSEDFVLDRVGPLVVCSACSGHGAKFAPLIGALVADLALDPGAVVPDRFRLETHGLSAVRGASL
jgi:monomeric sarcosine oxidase